MCGSHGAKHCNGPRWIQFMGQSLDNGGYAPFQIDYIFSDSDRLVVDNQSNTVYEPLYPKPISCDNVPPGLSPDDPASTCSCQECSTCLESAGERMLESYVSKLSGFERLKEKPSFAIYTLSTCATFGLLFFIFIVILVLVYFLVFNTREKSTYNGECGRCGLIAD